MGARSPAGEPAFLLASRPDTKARMKACSPIAAHNFLELTMSFSQNGILMGASFSHTRQDVERYRNLRAVSTKLNDRIAKTIPRRAYDEIGRRKSESGTTESLYSTAWT